MRGAARTAAALAIVLGALYVGLGLLRYDAAGAFHALWSGSLGSGYSLTSATLVPAVPLILTGLGVSIAFRAGVFNIGAERQLLSGAIAASAVAAPLGPLEGHVALLLAPL